MASDVDASCENDPNFAVICAFMEKFGKQCGLPPMDMSNLQAMLENTEEVPQPLVDLITNVLKKVKKGTKVGKWEKALVAMCHNYSSSDAWEIERFGFKKAKLSSKVRAVKEILEMQFDHHIKFKNEINKIAANDLRSQPLGRDNAGHAYWFQSDDNYQIRVYREDVDEETWTLIAKDREGLASLITKLSGGDTNFSSDSAANEDSNSLSDKPIIDTGQKVTSEESEESIDVKNSERTDEDQTEIKNSVDNDCTKRSRIEDDVDGKVTKVLKIHLTDFKKDPNPLEESLILHCIEEVPKETGNERGKDVTGEEKDVTKVEEKDDSNGDKENCSKESKEDGSKKEEDDVSKEEEGDVSKQESPIIGEVIEEETLFVKGEGSGAECETGNDEKDSTSGTQSDLRENCLGNSSANSIKDSLEEIRDNNDKVIEVPAFKLGTIIDEKTENNLSNLPDSHTKNSITDGKKLEESPLPKKSMFFFGSSSTKSLSSSLTIGFGDLSPKNESSKQNDVVENGTAKLENENKFSEKEDVKSPVSENIHTTKKEQVSNESDEPIIRETSKSKDRKQIVSERKTAVEEVICTKKIAYVCGPEKTSAVSTEKENERVGEAITEVKTIKEQKLDQPLSEQKTDSDAVQIENDGASTENEESSVKTKLESSGTSDQIEKIQSEKHHDVESNMEKPSRSVKKNASSNEQKKRKTDKCDSSTNSDNNESNAPFERKILHSIPPKNDMKKNEGEKSNEPVKEKEKGNNLSSQSDSDKSGQKLVILDSEFDDKTEILPIVTEDEKSLSQTEDQEENKVETRTTRSTRGSKCEQKPLQNKEQKVTIKKPIKPVKSKNSSEEEPKNKPSPLMEPEVVIIPESRRTRGKKEREATPPKKLQISIKKPKIVEPKKSNLVKDNSSVRSSSQESKSNITSVNSSRVSSPISIPDSVITVSDVEKDPLANSGEDVDITAEVPPKPMNIQQITFDFNDSSTPPPIPIIPSAKRTLRKRGREISPEVEIPKNDGKRMKLKGKRQINAKLRKSIEQQKQQQVSSSDEVVEVSDDDSVKKKKKKTSPPKPKKPPVSVVSTASDDSSTCPVKTSKKTSKGKNQRLLAQLGITDLDQVQAVGSLRASRRLAQMKIKEQAEQPVVEEKKNKMKKVKEEKLKGKKREAAPVKPEVVEVETTKKKKKKYKQKAPSKMFDHNRPWQSSSESSEEEEEEPIEEEEEPIEEDPPLVFKSDHEFSPESEVEGDEETQAPKRARTARKKEESDEKEPDEKKADEFKCQKCSKSDHPEWILLCDKCDNGWHCSCLRPPLLSIPEGDWFCPPCQHIKLVENLELKLDEFDKLLKKKELEDRRKERLEYVGISLNNVLCTNEQEHRKKKRRHSSEMESTSGEDSGSESEDSESDSDEPIYQLRQRRQARSYKFNEYDELIKSAIQDGMDEIDHEPAPQGRGKDIATIIRAEKEEQKEKALTESVEQKEVDENVGDGIPTTESQANNEKPKEDSEDEPIRPPVKKTRKKTRKMCALDVSSEEDDERDEDFKGTSSSSEEEDSGEEYSEDSDDYSRGGKRRKNLVPVRRSTRARVARFDQDFVNDDDDYDDAPRKKKKKQYWSESESSDSDSWGRKKKKTSFRKKKKSKKESILDELSDLEITKKKKRRIKYGGLTSSDEDIGRGRRTRGKKTTYVDTLGSDSEDERKRRAARCIESDDYDDEDFVANEEDDKDSKDSEEPPEEEEDLAQEEEKEERRPLIIPKIYIKKPLVPKESAVLSKKSEPVNQDKMESLEDDQKPKDEVKTENVQNKCTVPKAEIEKPLVEDKAKPLNPPKNVQVKPDKEEPSILKETIKAVGKPELEEYIDDMDDEDLDKLGNPIDAIHKNLDDMDSDEMEKMMEEEEYANKQLQLMAAQLEKEKKRKAKEEAEREEARQEEDARRSEEAYKMQQLKRAEAATGLPLEYLMNIEALKNMPKGPMKRGRKPKHRDPLDMSQKPHEPILSNVGALISNTDSNDELSEPPGVSIAFLSNMQGRKECDENPNKKRGRGKAKKSLEESLAHLGGPKRPVQMGSRMPPCDIEIAAPPQPFSQTAPAPSVITRMLQTKPGETVSLQTPSGYPVGTIRPKSFATMPANDDDDDDAPHPEPIGGGRFMHGGPRPQMHPFYRPGNGPPPHVPPHHYPHPRPSHHPLPSMHHQIRGPPPQHMYHHPLPPSQQQRLMDPSPSGGGTVPTGPEPGMRSQAGPPPSSSPNTSKLPPEGIQSGYGRPMPPVSRYPPISSAQNVSPSPPRPMTNMMTHMHHQPRPSNISPYPQHHGEQTGSHPPPHGSNQPPQQSPGLPPASQSPHNPQLSHPSANTAPQHMGQQAPSTGASPSHHPPPTTGPPHRMSHQPQTSGPPPTHHPPPNTAPPQHMGQQQPASGPPPPHHPTPMSHPPLSTSTPQGNNHSPPNNPPYYGTYPPEEDAMPPSAYQNSPYQESYGCETGEPEQPEENSDNSKQYGVEESGGGEFGGLVSYFSSQQEEDLES